jgi:hypothetical protein
MKRIAFENLPRAANRFLLLVFKVGEIAPEFFDSAILIVSRAWRSFVQRGFHGNEPLLIEILQCVDEILRNIGCREFTHAGQGVLVPALAVLQFP